jgi:hypothetical protein
MDDDALIEAAAADAAAGVTAINLDGWVGLMLYMYGEDLSAVAWGMPDLDAPLGIAGDTMDELGMLEGHGEAITALRTRVADGGDRESVERFYLALARHAHGLIGRPVLVYESMLMPEEEQLARQGGRGEATADPLARLDVIVSVRVDEHRVAAVWRGAEGDVEASGSVGHTDEVTSIWRCTQLGSDPVVLAGQLPPGAVAAVVADGEPVVSGGYWICVTRSRTLRRDPEISFLDVDGNVFEHDVPFDGLPRLWPTQAPPGARLVQRGGGTEVLEADEWRVEITDWGPFAPAAGEVAHELGIEEAGVPARPLAGSVLGRRHGFELAAQGGVWAAVATCGAFAVTVEGRGEPPKRLDLERLEAN